MFKIEVVQLFDDCAQVKISSAVERSDEEHFQVIDDIVVSVY